MKKNLSGIIVGLLLFFIFPTPVGADYVLPYPAYMPGHKFYRLSRVIDELKTWWYWGSIASWKYHSHLSDKYLVEAKTLFEYRQYLYALDALERSNKEFQIAPTLIEKAEREGKRADLLKAQTREAAATHIKVLEKLISELPKEFLWTPEKDKSTNLQLSVLLNNAISQRQDVLGKIK